MTLLAAPVAVGAGVLAWSLAEAAWFHRLHVGEVRPHPAPAGFTVLHLSDTHLLPRLHARRRFVRSLAQRVQPDLVVFTGDGISSPEGMPALLDALDGLLDLPGVFVFGSNDYVGPRMRNPLSYLWRSSSGSSSNVRRLPAEAFAAALRNRGWLDLRNARGTLRVNGMTMSFVGVDDPHVGFDSIPPDEGVRGDLHIGVAHAPYSRVLDAFREEGCAVSLFGHTHGGQVCVPGRGALVTNSDIPTWRASGLQGWPGLRPDGLALTPRPPFAPVPSELPDDGRIPMWVNISSGLGTSPYAPIRLACPPTASVLRFAHPGDF
nr:metallophosphoesterase [Actinomycetales bacterium]